MKIEIGDLLIFPALEGWPEVNYVLGYEEREEQGDEMVKTITIHNGEIYHRAWTESHILRNVEKNNNEWKVHHWKIYK
jgi:hypothetical protein